MTLLDASFMHNCPFPSNHGLRRRPWTCEVCGRTWKPFGKGGWETNDPEARLDSVTMRYPDGTKRTF